MNRENVLKVADAIEQHSIPDLGFNMGYFMWDSTGGKYDKDHSGHNCGTVACIAGWARVVRTKRRFKPTPQGFDEYPWSREADWMGITHEQGYALFSVDDSPFLERITTKEAVAVLRHLAETGEVDWSVADTVPA